MGIFIRSLQRRRKMKRIILAMMVILICLQVTMPVEVVAQIPDQNTHRIVIHGEPVDTRSIGSFQVQIFKMDILERKDSGQWSKVKTYEVTRHAYGEINGDKSRSGHWGKNGDTPPSFVNENGFFYGRIYPSPGKGYEVILLSDDPEGCTINVPGIKDPNQGERTYVEIHKKGETAMLGCVGFWDVEAYDEFLNIFGKDEEFQVYVEPAPIDPNLFLPPLDKPQNREKELMEIIRERQNVMFAANRPGGIDFRSISLNYISASESGHFNYAMDLTGAEEGDKVINVEATLGDAIDFFFIGLTLPNQKFWVNLNPWEPDRIVDEGLGTTDVGRIMLEADLQMKKDFCKHENPSESKVGESYWDLLDKKRDELVTECMNDYPGQIEATRNVLFNAVTRHWIVPGEVTAYGDGYEIYIADVTLDIYSEPVYEHSTFEIVNQDESSISEDCLKSLDQAAKEYGRYAMELEEELVLPLVVEEVNSGEFYSDLRQVYVSLALAQWYKERVDGQRMFSDLIDSEDLTGLESEAAWSPRDIWEKYVESYEEGEYQYEKTRTYTRDGFIVTETTVYTGGGVLFGDILSHISMVGDIDPEIEETITDAMDVPFTNRGNDYYFGDRLYSPVSAPPDGEGGWIRILITSIVEGAWIAIPITLVVIGCFLYLIWRGVRRKRMGRRFLNPVSF